MRGWLLQNGLLAKNAIDHSGSGTFALRNTLFSCLNLLVIALILHPVPEGKSIWEYMASTYVYFLPMLTLSAAVGSYEIELFSGTGEWLLLSPGSWWRGRMLSVFLEVAAPVAVFVALFLHTHRAWQDWLLAVALIAVFSWMGLSIGFIFGFRNEKSVNNFNNAVIWVLGFGPGPFMGLGVKWYQGPFPGAQSLLGNYSGEALKVFGYVLAAASLHFYASRPRRYRFFAK